MIYTQLHNISSILYSSGSGPAQIPNAVLSPTDLGESPRVSAQPDAPGRAVTLCAADVGHWRSWTSLMLRHWMVWTVFLVLGPSAPADVGCCRVCLEKQVNTRPPSVQLCRFGRSDAVLRLRMTIHQTGYPLHSNRQATKMRKAPTSTARLPDSTATAIVMPTQ